MIVTYSIPKTYKLFINNEWVPSTGSNLISVRSPISGEELTNIPVANQRDVDRAVSTAYQTFHSSWCHVPARKRQELLLALADRVVEDAQRIAWLETANTGKAIRESHANVLTAADRLRFFASACRLVSGDSFPVNKNTLSIDHRSPIGVIGLVGAWNFPLNMFLGKIAPALAAGNTVVYKPADATPITTLEICSMIAEIFPPGVINVVTGDGPSTGQALIEHGRVGMVSLTGSTATGKQVMQAASKSIKKVTLELGGKNAQIVFPDADLDRAAQGVLLGAFLNQGQVCTAGSRIFAHKEIAAALQEKVVNLIPKLNMGDPFSPDTRMGTLCFEKHFERVNSYIQLGLSEGAHLVTGGKRAAVPGYPNALFLEPTIFDEVTPDMRISNEEIFGPVALMYEWSDYEEMMTAVNGVEQGLAAGIWTTNLSTAHRTAQRTQAGRIWINCYNLFPSGAAFGGIKASGFGREDAFETVCDFTEIKNVILDFSESQRTFY